MRAEQRIRALCISKTRNQKTHFVTSVLFVLFVANLTMHLCFL